MKLYNVHPEKRQFNWGEMDVITLGERGRGRKEVYIPFHVISFDEKGSNYEIGQTKNGMPKIIASNENTEGYIAVLSGKGCYTRGTYGTVYIFHEDKEKIKVLAYGYGAYGAAGRIGNWGEFLVVIIPPYPIRIRVRPAGGAHKISRYWLIFQRDGICRVKDEEAEIFTETTGIYLPPAENLSEEGVLLDLAYLK